MNDCLFINLHQLNAKIKNDLNKSLSTVDLTYNQWLVLKQIKANESVCASEITKQLNMPKGTLSGVINKLLTRGLITASSTEIDKREINLALTKQTASMCDRILKIENDYKDYLLKEISDEEMVKLQEMISKLK